MKVYHYFTATVKLIFNKVSSDGSELRNAIFNSSSRHVQIVRVGTLL